MQNQVSAFARFEFMQVDLSTEEKESRRRNLENKILLSRFLTRSGDQAWDFALPVVLVALFPQNFSLIAFIFLVSKLGNFFLQPVVASIIDTWQRFRVVVIGTALQLFSVLTVTVCVVSISLMQSVTEVGVQGHTFWLLVAGVVLGTLGSSVGSILMEIAVGNDWIPTAVSADDLPRVNSRMKQIDLLTEVLSPVVAGVLLSLSSPDVRLLGFLWVVAWNVVSFFPELFLLKSVFLGSKRLQQLNAPKDSSLRLSLIRKTFDGWRDFAQHPSALVMVAYACLWLSALSPHGVLLTSFLKGGWQISETMLGVFRGLGAVFGLLATVCFPVVIRRVGLLRGTQFFILFQAIVLVAALPLFAYQSWGGVGFLGLVLLSRIGLYGFSIGEMEIRQRTVAEGQRGRVSGVASALTSFATLMLFGAGSLVAEHSNFVWLVILSVASVSVGAVLYSLWLRGSSRELSKC